MRKINVYPNTTIIRKAQSCDYAFFSLFCKIVYFTSS